MRLLRAGAEVHHYDMSTNRSGVFVGRIKVIVCAVSEFAFSNLRTGSVGTRTRMFISIHSVVLGRLLGKLLALVCAASILASCQEQKTKPGLEEKLASVADAP